MIDRDIASSDKNRYEWEDLIDCWIFDEKDREILKRKFSDNATFETIANEVDLSVVQVKRRFKRAKAQLFKRI